MGSLQPCFVASAKQVCATTLDVLIHNMALGHESTSSTWKCIFYSKMKTSAPFLQAILCMTFGLQVKTPGNRNPAPENFPEPQNHMCLMEEMLYALALQGPCFSSLCHCALSELLRAGGATASLLLQELGKAVSSA